MGTCYRFSCYYMYGCGSHLGHVTRSIYTILSPFPLRPIIKFGFDWSSGIREDVWKQWLNRSWTTDGHHLDVSCQVLRSLYIPFWRRRFLDVFFLPYMGVAAILVMWPWLFIWTFLPLSHGGSIWNLAFIVQRRSWVYYKLTLWLNA